MAQQSHIDPSGVKTTQPTDLWYIVKGEEIYAFKKRERRYRDDHHPKRRGGWRECRVVFRSRLRAEIDAWLRKNGSTFNHLGGQEQDYDILQMDGRPIEVGSGFRLPASRNIPTIHGVEIVGKAGAK